MPRTLSTSDMVTPGRLSPPPTEPTDGEQAMQPFLDGAPASLDTLIQHLVPTADYYPEVGEPASGEEKEKGRKKGGSLLHSGIPRAGNDLGPGEVEQAGKIPSHLALCAYVVFLAESFYLHLPTELSPLHRASGASGQGLPSMY